MWIKWPGLFLAAALIGVLFGGCGKPSSPPLVLHPAPIETVAAIHWLGKQRLAADTNAASIMSVWDMPESQKLEAQTLDRLAVGLVGGSLEPKAQSLESKTSTARSNAPSAAPSPKSATHILATNAAEALKATRNTEHATPTNASTTPPPGLDSRPKTLDARLLTGPAAQLRPLLDDLLQQESFLEVREATNLPGVLIFAIHLSDPRARLWETNLAAVLEGLTGSRVAAVAGRSNGWVLQFSTPGAQGSPVSRKLDVARAGEWTVIGLGHETNVLTTELLDSIRQGGLTSDSLLNDVCLYADADLHRVASALLLDWSLPADLPRVTVDMRGDGPSVRTRGQFNFPKPLPADLPAWNIPTNLMHEPICSFTAIRGIAPWLASCKSWTDLHIGAPPDQLYFWAQQGLPFLTFCAAPLPNASNEVYQLTDRLLQDVNPELATNGMGHFVRGTNFNGAAWTDVPIMDPSLRLVSTPGGDFAVAGLNPNPSTNRPAPAGLFYQVLSSTNLVAYDWEITGPRVQQWLFSGQFLRMVTHHAQVPPKSASVAWLMALENKLGNCVTGVTKTGPAQLSLLRRSTIGFTAVELHLLADWLESPQFPRGLNTFLGEPDLLPFQMHASHPVPHAHTNSVAPAHR
ncbi:MAG TPA: hypothetical protein VMU04_20825 [Candidatus Acidoferrum sp.]|nr:hypothetical protein [Candidatus Acidoferrum sp.]